MTLGLSLVFQNIALLFWKADFRSTVTWYSTAALRIGPFSISLSRLFAFILCAVLSSIVFIVLLKTDIGKSIRAVAVDSETATLVGINKETIFQITFGIAFALIGSAGAFFMPILYVYPTVGGFFTSIASVIVVLGGYGSVRGAVLGGFVIGLTESLTVLFAPAEAQYFGPFLVFILVLLLKPEGLFGGGRV